MNGPDAPVQTTREQFVPGPRSSRALVVLALLVAGCASQPAAKTPAPDAAPATASLPCRMTAPEECTPAGRGLLWYRTSAERRAVYSQTFQFAGERVAQLAAGHRPGSWAVVMDADETILDNSEFMFAVARGEKSDSREAWIAWAGEKRAGLQPGAEGFVNRVRQLGGMVIVVTNRDDAACPATQQNLADLGIVVRGVLCATNGVYNKNPRFDSIRDGTSALGLGPIDVLMFVGDNIRDFPGRSQSEPDPLSSFGDTFIVLPNPMYGSWDKNTLR